MILICLQIKVKVISKGIIDKLILSYSEFNSNGDKYFLNMNKTLKKQPQKSTQTVKS